MAQFLLISGSPRAGNTEFILKKIYEALIGEKELILLREKNIKQCCGCLCCNRTNKCGMQDDMQMIYEKIQQADVLVVGSPNYFDNISGLLKNFIDRSNPFYGTDLLKGKKIFFIVVGGGSVEHSQRVVQVLSYFAEAHKLEVVGPQCFQALGPNDLVNKPESLKRIDELVEKVNFFSK
jgi:multimeric flavodoxin WrbA